MFIETLIQNIIVIFSILMILRCFANYTALPQNMYDTKTLESAERIFKDDKKAQNFFVSKAFLVVKEISLNLLFY